jgi:O-antigen ligase
MATAVVLALAWGALSYGAVDSWAYWPLLAACTGIGLWGLMRRGHRAPFDTSVVWGLAAILAAVAVQIVPLPRTLLLALSPSTDAFLRNYDLLYEASIAAGGAPSHPLSIDPSATARGVVFIAALSVLFLGLVRGLNRRQTEQIVMGLTVFSGGLALLAMVQRAVSPGFIYGRAAPGAFGTFANRNHFAGWMLMALPLALGYVASRSRVPRGVTGWRERLVWLSSRRASQVILMGLAAFTMSLALVMTLSRSGIIAFAIALAVTVWFLIRRQKQAQRGLAFASLLLFGLLSIGWVGVDRVVQKFAAADEMRPGSRLTIWRDALGVVRRFPVAGTGMNTYDTAMLAYETIEVDSKAEEAHNDYLQLVAEGGLLVAGATAALVIILAREMRRRFREDRNSRMPLEIRAGAAIGLLAIGLQELVEFSLQLPGNAALFVVLFAIALRKEQLHVAVQSPV